MNLGGSGETHGDELASLSEDLVTLDVADSLDGQQGLSRGVGQSLNRVEPGFNELLHICRTDSM